MRKKSFPLLVTFSALSACGGDWGRIECGRKEITREPAQSCGRFESTTKGVRYNSINCYPSGRTALVERCAAAKCRKGFTHGGGEPKLGLWQSGPPRACLTKEEAERRGASQHR